MTPWILAALLAARAGAPAPETTPTPPPQQSAAAVKQLIDEGVALHDKKDFDGAIAKYRQALDLDPGNGRALFEMAYSQYEKKDLKAALESAEKAALTPQPARMLAVMLGNIYDDIGEPQKAIAAYRKGLEKDPDFFLLYYNLGTAYERLAQRDLARAAYENAVSLRPQHPSSHLGLARIYKEQGYRIPAILAATRFLVLEPASPRSAGAVKWIDELFQQGVEVKDASHTNITVDADRPKDEGDFTGADLMASMVQASKNLSKEEAGEREGPFEMDRLRSLLTMVAEVEDAQFGKGFAAEYYVPFAKKAAERKATAALAAAALRGTTSAEIADWIAAHKKEMDDFASLAESYQWPKVRPKLPEGPAP